MGCVVIESSGAKAFLKKIGAATSKPFLTMLSSTSTVAQKLTIIEASVITDDDMVVE